MSVKTGMNQDNVTCVHIIRASNMQKKGLPCAERGKTYLSFTIKLASHRENYAALVAE